MLRFLRVKKWNVCYAGGRREFRFPTVAIRRRSLSRSLFIRLISYKPLRAPWRKLSDVEYNHCNKKFHILVSNDILKYRNLLDCDMRKRTDQASGSGSTIEIPCVTSPRPILRVILFIRNSILPGKCEKDFTQSFPPSSPSITPQECRTYEENNMEGGAGRSYPDSY